MYFRLKPNVLKKTNCASFCCFIFGIIVCLHSNAQMITGVWRGTINKQKAEVKIILNGDRLTGTAYYYHSQSQFRRYSIKGYFDAETNEAVWWDDQLVEESDGRSVPGKMPMLSRADFNCPGDGRMMLDGKTGEKEANDPKNNLHLDKIENGIFSDEWDFVIDNYLVGANDPNIIDSIGSIAFNEPMITIEEEPIVLRPVPASPKKDTVVKTIPPPVVTEEKKEPVVIAAPPTIQEKFIARKKVFVTEIPVSGDSVELRFYDNAEIDGDSISLFLNNKLIFEHVKLLGSAFTIKLAVSDLSNSNELIMVAENLGSIPPNTSYMVAEAGGKRFEAQLASTEGSSAMIRLVKEKSGGQ